MHVPSGKAYSIISAVLNIMIRPINKDAKVDL